MDRKDSNARYYEKHKDDLRSSPARLAARQRYEAKRCARNKAARVEKRRARQAALALAEKKRSDEWYESEMARLDAKIRQTAEERSTYR